MPRSNPWSTRHGLNDKTVYLYSGTLARKHNPSILVDLARAVADINGMVVVVSEGEGASQISSAIASDTSLTNLRVLPYQPFVDLPTRSRKCRRTDRPVGASGWPVQRAIQDLELSVLSAARPGFDAD